MMGPIPGMLRNAAAKQRIAGIARRLVSTRLAAVTLAMLSLGSASYLFSLFGALNIHLH